MMQETASESTLPVRGIPGTIPPLPQGTLRVKPALDLIIYLAVRMVLAVIQAMPMALCSRIASPLAHLCCWLGVRHAVIDDNLRHAFPELSAEERRSLELAQWRHILLMIFEIAHVDRTIRDTNWRTYADLQDHAPTVRRLLSTRPAVLVAGHFGNFEISARLVGMFGFPMFTVARPLDNLYLDRWVERFRTRFGQTVLPKQGSAQEADARLAAGGVLAVLADQSAGRKGCFVDFFGRPASTHKAIAVMALAHEAPLIVCCCRRTTGPMRFAVEFPGTADPRDGGAETNGVRELTAWYTKWLEWIIRRDPEQYWWVHRRWKDSRPVRDERRAAA
jgi:KDO2-lipid IV(A) lauroyltransferase